VSRVVPPSPVLDDAFFWEGVTRHELLLRRCAQCARLHHPPSPMCPHCGSVQWRTEAASGAGTVHSWIVSAHPTQPDDSPRIVVLVDLAEGVRFVANLTGIDAADVTVGLPVRVTFETVGGVLLPQFRPAGAEEA
jgi:uncharacterized OB-fold protein